MFGDISAQLLSDDLSKEILTKSLLRFILKHSHCISLYNVCILVFSVLILLSHWYVIIVAGVGTNYMHVYTTI